MTTTGRAKQAEIAEAIGVTPPSIGRWAKGTNGPDPRQAAAFARAYSRPVLEAFIAAGFLTAEEAAQRPAAIPSLDSLSDDELLEELKKRMAGAKQQPENKGETKIETPVNEPFLRLAARKSSEPKGYEDPYPDEGC